MPYKKKFKLPGLTWDTFIKFFFADIRKHIYKKKFFAAIKKISICLSHFGTHL